MNEGRPASTRRVGRLRGVDACAVDVGLVGLELAVTGPPGPSPGLLGWPTGTSGTMGHCLSDCRIGRRLSHDRSCPSDPSADQCGRGSPDGRDGDKLVFAELGDEETIFLNDRVAESDAVALGRLDGFELPCLRIPGVDDPELGC